MRIYNLCVHSVCFCFVCFCFWLFLPAAAQADGSKSRLQQTVTMEQENASLATLAADFADKTGQSLLIEGQPLSKIVSIKATQSADKMLTAISEPFGYDWTLSKSGVVLLRKRFVDREDVPEFDAAELQAVSGDMLEAIRAILPDAGANRTIHDLLPAFMQSLSREHRKIVGNNGHLKLGDLPLEQQQMGAQIIYAQVLQPVYAKWETLQTMLRCLPRATLQHNLRPFITQFSVRENVWMDEIVIPLGDGTEKLFTINMEAAAKNAGPLDASPAGPVAASPKLAVTPGKRLSTPDVLALGPCTIGHMISALRASQSAKITLAPAVAGRRLIVELRRASVEQAPSALAEMHEWALTRTDTGSYILLRRAYQPPQNMRDLALVIKAAFPADIRRFLLAEPAPDTNEQVLPPPTPELFQFLN